jgi:hypothetical protein
MPLKASSSSEEAVRKRKSEEQARNANVNNS